MRWIHCKVRPFLKNTAMAVHLRQHGAVQGMRSIDDLAYSMRALKKTLLINGNSTVLILLDLYWFQSGRTFASSPLNETTRDAYELEEISFQALVSMTALGPKAVSQVLDSNACYQSEAVFDRTGRTRVIMHSCYSIDSKLCPLHEHINRF